MRALFVSAASMAFLLAGSQAYAQDSLMAQAYGYGHFAGAATYCGVPRPDVLRVAIKLLTLSGVDTSGPGPAMAKFTEGVSEAIVTMRQQPDADCEGVKADFAGAKMNLQ